MMFRAPMTMAVNHFSNCRIKIFDCVVSFQILFYNRTEMYVGSLMTSLRYQKWSIILVFESNLYLRSWSFLNFDHFLPACAKKSWSKSEMCKWSIDSLYQKVQGSTKVFLCLHWLYLIKACYYINLKIHCSCTVVNHYLLKLPSLNYQSENEVGIFLFTSLSFLVNNLRFTVKLIDKAIVINGKIHKNKRKRFY